MKTNKFWLWDYRAENRWHRSTVFLNEDGYSTDGNHYPVIGLAEEKRKVPGSELILEDPQSEIPKEARTAAL